MNSSTNLLLKVYITEWFSFVTFLILNNGDSFSSFHFLTFYIIITISSDANTRISYFNVRYLHVCNVRYLHVRNVRILCVVS